jgi:hypothetical protein
MGISLLVGRGASITRGALSIEVGGLVPSGPGGASR